MISDSGKKVTKIGMAQLKRKICRCSAGVLFKKRDVLNAMKHCTVSKKYYIPNHILFKLGVAGEKQKKHLFLDLAIFMQV